MSWTERLLAPGDALRQWWDGLSRVQKWGFGVVGFGLLALLPLFPPPFLNTPNISFGGTMAQFAMVAIIAIGLNVVVGQAGLLDLGYVGFYAVAYTVALLTSPSSPLNKVGPTGFFSEGGRGCRVCRWRWPSAALAGLILGTPTLRLRGDYLAIVTLGFGEIIRLLADNLAGITNGPRGLPGVEYPRLGESERLPDGVLQREYHRRRQLRHLVVLARHHPDGHHPAAGRQPRTQPGRTRLGRHSGGRRRRGSAGRQHLPVQAVGFVIGAAIGGLSGALYAGQVQFVAPPTFNIINSMLFLCAVVLGGQGKLGVIVGAFIIVYLPNRLIGVEFLGINMGDLKYLFFGMALVVLMIFRPRGCSRPDSNCWPTVRPPRDAAPSSGKRRRPHERRRIGWGTSEFTLPRRNPGQDKGFDGQVRRLVALDSVTFNIRRGEILGMIGPNGAGKTTCFNAITGVYRPTSGSVVFDGAPLGRMAPSDHPPRHCPHVPEHPAVGRDDRAGERHGGHRCAALYVGARRAGSHPAAQAGGTFGGRTRRGAAALRRHRPPRRGEGQELAYGDQRRLRSPRPATEPKLLCLDEPAAGFNPRRPR